MGEDMTYTTVPTLADVRRDRDAVMAANVSLNKRARDLEAQLNAAIVGAAELAQRVAQLEQERDELREDLADVLYVCVARGDSLGYCDDDYRQWLDELRPESAVIDDEVQP